MDKNEKEKLKSETLDNLKLKLEKKLEKVKSELKILNFKLENNVNDQSVKIKNKINKYICSLKDKSIAYVKDKEKKIQDKEIMNKIYFNAIRTSKKIERFQKNMNDIIFDSINNYNNFISYYKNSCLLFLRNHEDKICNNNIYSKITKKQADKIYHQLNSKNLKYFIHEKFPVDIKILIDDYCIEETLVLSSNNMNLINNIEIDNLSDNSFDDVFDNVIKWKNKKINMNFKNCELKGVKLYKIPFLFLQVIINDSKINHSIFNK